MMRLNHVLDVLAEFEAEWHSKHSTVWTDAHWAEYTQAKRDYLFSRLDEEKTHGEK